MIAIVAHGIIGTTYQRDIVVKPSLVESDSLNVLHNISHQLSTQFGDDTPMTGWAMQPAPDGMWLSRIERAFSTNHNTAYVMISFLIPLGNTLLTYALKYIESNLLANHSKYIQQNIILNKPDWSFLHLLGQKLERLMGNSNYKPTFTVHKTLDAAYWPGDMPSMLNNLWDVRFQFFNIIFCGNRILSSEKQYVSIEDVPYDGDYYVNQGSDSIFPNEVSDKTSSEPEIKPQESTKSTNNGTEIITNDTEYKTSYIIQDVVSSENNHTLSKQFDKDLPINSVEQLLNNQIPTTKAQESVTIQKVHNDTIKNILVILTILFVLLLVYLFINGSMEDSKNDGHLLLEISPNGPSTEPENQIFIH